MVVFMLKGLFARLPDRCVILLEDTNAVGATCSRGFRLRHRLKLAEEKGDSLRHSQR